LFGRHSGRRQLFADFSADRNGLWALTALTLNNHTLVTKFKPFPWPGINKVLTQSKAI